MPSLRVCGVNRVCLRQRAFTCGETSTSWKHVKNTAWPLVSTDDRKRPRCWSMSIFFFSSFNVSPALSPLCVDVVLSVGNGVRTDGRIDVTKHFYVLYCWFDSENYHELVSNSGQLVRIDNFVSGQCIQSHCPWFFLNKRRNLYIEATSQTEWRKRHQWGT